MKRNILLTLWLLLPAAVLFGQGGENIYSTYCAGCHGSRMQGSTAGKLIKTDWQYGRGKAAIVRNIRFGIPGTEMVAWGTALTNEQINEVADYIVAAQEVAPNAIRPVPERLTTKDYILKVEKLVSEGLSTPWGIEFVDDRRALITERTGNIRWMIDGKLDPQPVAGVPRTYSQHTTGGLMDVALDPDYARNGWVYIGFSHTVDDPADKEARGMTKVVRGKIRDHQWVNEQTLFEVPDSLKIPGGNRWGCRFLFDKQGHLYFTIGDMARGIDSQDPGKPSGKVFRIHPDGSIPKDNPYRNKKGMLPAIFTIGNRNVQGLAQHPVTGEIWATEHGPMGGDELNILKNGGNYGWPLVTYGVDYSGEIVSEKTEMPGMEQPVLHWTPSIGVGAAEFVTGAPFARWKNNLIVGALAFEEIRRIVIEGREAVSQEIIMKGYGRVRDVKPGPDGALYVLLNSPDMILRITPEKER